jgi:hypothetical protein
MRFCQGGCRYNKFKLRHNLGYHMICLSQLINHFNHIPLPSIYSMRHEERNLSEKRH